MEQKTKSISSAARDVTRPPRELDSRVWTKDGELRPEVRSALMKIAEDVWEGTEPADADLLDVTLTGSTTGPRWSPSGDLDVHLLVKFKDAECNEEMTAAYFRLRSKLWNSQHKIEVASHPVEVYIQDADEPHFSAGIYSLLNNEWVQRNDLGEWAPYKDVAKKAKVLARDINDMVKKTKDEPTDSKIDALAAMMERLREMRRSGLEEDGEGSVENLAYKVLRRAGYLDKLSDATNEAFNDLFSR